MRGGSEDRASPHSQRTPGGCAGGSVPENVFADDGTAHLPPSQQHVHRLVFDGGVYIQRSGRVRDGAS